MEWKDISWYDWLYQISDIWVRSLKRWKIKMMSISYNGRYPTISLYKKWCKRHSVHRLVAMAFIPNPENLPEIDHINNNKNDFRACNLQWIWRKENMKKAFSDKIIPAFWSWKIWDNHPKSKRVLQKTKWGMIIREWENSSIAWESLYIPQGNICQVCNWKRISAWWFLWEYI